MAEALESLSPRDRLFVDLHFYRGLPPKEVAAILKTSVNAIYTQKSRILGRLRQSLASGRAF
jgi:RNA polymerase sigma factor (sigma-70 family)